MHIAILSVGRWRRGPERELFDRYAARCAWRIELVELVLRGAVPAGQLRAAESRLIETQLGQHRRCIALDERGDLLDSQAFAARLGAIRDTGLGGAAFVIGGAEGIDETLRARADATIALGRVTWPHLLVRVLLAEQLYRASTILAGHPYHRAGD